MVSSSLMFFVLAILAIFFAGTAIVIYNGLVTSRNNVQKAWQNIDVVLQQRNEELPKLIDTCKGYVTHETDLLTQITKLRTTYAGATDLQEKVKIENDLSAVLERLQLVWEQYPDLKAVQSFLQLQDRISALESKIADYRETFNDAVNLYNIQIERFPDLIMAGPLGYRRQAFLEVPEIKKQDVKVAFHS